MIDDYNNINNSNSNQNGSIQNKNIMKLNKDKILILNGNQIKPIKI